MSKKQRVVFTFEPLSASDLLQFANNGMPIPSNRVLATFGNPKNWIQIYHGETSRPDYEPRACEWAFIGPVRPPYELATYPLEHAFTMKQVTDALSDAFQRAGSMGGRDARVAKYFHEILSARTGPGKANEIRALLAEREEVETKP